MTKFIRILIVLVLLSTNLFSCALCALQTPTAHIDLQLETSDDDVLTAIDVTWYFSENFTELTIGGYDANANAKLDPDELKDIKQTILDYIVPRSMLMKFETYNDDPKQSSPEIKPLSGAYGNFKVDVENNHLVFKFTKKTKLKLTNNLVLRLNAYDNENFFQFLFLQKDFTQIKDIKAVQNSTQNASFIKFTTKNPITANSNKDTNTQSAPINAEKNATTTKQNYVAPDLSQIDDKASLLDSTSWLVKLKNVLKNDSTNPTFFGIFWIVLVSFVYGFIHAAGPGHAKVLTASYFLTNKVEYTKAFLFSLKIGFLHVIASFVIVVISMFISEVVASTLSRNTVSFTMKISAVFIILIGIFVFVDKIRSLTKKANTQRSSKT